MSWIAQVWCGERIDPWALNPYRKGDCQAGKVVTATPEESAIGWGAMNHLFTGSSEWPEPWKPDEKR